MSRIFSCICIILFISSINLNAQFVSVKGVIHADTAQVNTPFPLSFYFVNTGPDTLFMDSIIANVGFSILGVPQIPIQLSFSENIPLNIFAPGDSIFILPPLVTLPVFSTGDHIVIIWPSSIVPIVTDTSITDLYVISTISNINENLPQNFNRFNTDIYDLLGRRYDNINCIPLGTIYIRDSKKYIKVKE